MEKPSVIVEVPALVKAQMVRIVPEAFRKQVEITQVIKIGKFSRNIILFHNANVCGMYNL